MAEQALQERTVDLWGVCYGCGPKNEQGLQIKSYWDGEQAVCTWRPQPHHTAAPGILNGGIIASIMDCHSVWTAIAHAYQAEGREPGSEPPIVYVTASLQVDYRRPTPLDGPITLRASIKEVEGRRTKVVCSLMAGDIETAHAETVAARVSSAWQDSS